MYNVHVQIYACIRHATYHHPTRQEQEQEQEQEIEIEKFADLGLRMYLRNGARKCVMGFWDRSGFLIRWDVRGLELNSLRTGRNLK